MMEFAFIDLGTNSAKLFIYDKSASGWKLQRKHRVPVLFGDGIYRKGVISDEAEKRVLQGFDEFKKLIQKYKVERIRAVATSAMRDAKDGKRLAEKIYKRTEIDLEIISGDEEARLIALGVVSQIDPPEVPCALIDIGGGSTEISFFRQRQILYYESIRAGAARGQFKYLKDVPPQRGQESIRELRGNIRKKLKIHFDGHVPDFEQGSLIYGSSGSIRALARIHAAHERKKASLPFDRSFLKQFISETAGLSVAEIQKIRKLEKRRAEIILSAAILLDEAMDYLGLNIVVPVSFALKDGLLADSLT